MAKETLTQQRDRLLGQIEIIEEERERLWKNGEEAMAQARKSNRLAHQAYAALERSTELNALLVEGRDIDRRISLIGHQMRDLENELLDDIEADKST